MINSIEVVVKAIGIVQGSKRLNGVKISITPNIREIIYIDFLVRSNFRNSALARKNK